jgi:hypothetical protein
VRKAFSLTAVPRNVNRLPQSSSTAAPVSEVTGLLGTCLLSVLFGLIVMANKIAAIANAATLQNLDFISAPLWIV